MPNWCENTVWISNTDEKKMVELVEAIKKGNFLNYLVPMDLKFLETEEWYDWRIANWGCKWDINPDDICSDLDEFEEGDLDIYFNFDSPNGPPIPAMKCAFKQGFNVTLKYDEIGNQYMGVFKDGIDHCLEY